MRFVDGVGERTGLMGVDFPTALWLHKYVILLCKMSVRLTGVYA